MTIQQIKYVLEVAQCGSISRAAKTLYTSQPNISSAVKSLEDELHIEIFRRTPSGIMLTKVGCEFVRRSRSLLYDMESLENLQEASETCQLTVCGSQYPLIDSAFVRLCAAHQAKERFQLARKLSNVIDTIDMVHMGKSDLGILVTNVKQQYSVQISTTNHELLYEPLFQLPLSVQLRADHPLLKEGEPNINLLWDYTFINQDETGENFNGYAGLSAFAFINPARSISASNPSLRSDLLLKTDAYCLAFPIPTERDAEHFAFFPLDLDMEFGAICRKDSCHNPTLSEFLRILCEEAGVPEKDFFANA